ncbi:MAG: hypothetical protein JW915_03385 [Chitinispirillaceae bacterium]|nr:hypothetical protein [Chitinispirillaceae bacterium]
MGYDKFGLDWSVWGSKSSSGGSSSNPHLDGIGSGWSSTPNQKTVEDEDPEEAPVSVSSSVRLRNAKFLPDGTTDFNKPCKVQVEVESSQPVSAQVIITLWGKYKEEEYNLQHEVKVYPENGLASGELKLFYIDAYYDDVASGVTGESVFYIAKCSLKGASPIDSEPLQMPLVENITLIFEDDDGNVISNVKVTIATGEEFLSGDDGKVTIPANADGSEVEVVKIEIGEAQGEPEVFASQTDMDTTSADTVVPITDNPVSQDEKVTVIYFKDNTGKVLSNTKVLLSDGRSFVSDEKGEVSIPSADASQEMSISLIELA